MSTMKSPQYYWSDVVDSAGNDDEEGFGDGQASEPEGEAQEPEDADPNVDAIMKTTTATQPTMRRKRMWRFGVLTVLFVTLLVITIVYASKRERTSVSWPTTDVAADEAQPAQTASSSSGSTPSTSTSCDLIYDCQTDRLGNRTPLYPGEAICNRGYAFGLTTEGVFQLHDCVNDETQVFFTPDIEDKHDVYFVMETDASFNIYRDEDEAEDEDDELLQQWDSKKKVGFTAKCLPRPLLDCPYLHLHKGGVVVLNYIDDNDDWNDRNIRRVYPDLFQDN